MITLFRNCFRYLSSRARGPSADQGVRPTAHRCFLQWNVETRDPLLPSGASRRLAVNVIDNQSIIFVEDFRIRVVFEVGGHQFRRLEFDGNASGLGAI